VTISGTAQLIGRFRYMSLVPSTDTSSNPTWLSDVLETMACSGRKEEEYTLVADGDTAVSFGSIATAGASLVVVKVMPFVGVPPSPGFPNGVPAAPNPVVVKLTSGAGSATIPVDPFAVLFAVGVPYTAMTVARAAGVQTTVRIQLFSAGS